MACTRNRHVKGFGSYGDIMIRDRKMYVVPTPYALAEGMESHLTLVVPAQDEAPRGLVAVGDLVRQESGYVLVGYDFDLVTNDITPHFVANTGSGRTHTFQAYRHVGPGTATRV